MAIFFVPLSAHRPPLIVCPCASWASPSPHIVLVVRIYVSLVLRYLFILSRRPHRLRRYRMAPRHRFDNFDRISLRIKSTSTARYPSTPCTLHGAGCRSALPSASTVTRMCNSQQVDLRIRLSTHDIVSPLYRRDQSSRYLSSSPSHPPTMLVSSVPVLYYLDVVMLELSYGMHFHRPLSMSGHPPAITLAIPPRLITIPHYDIYLYTTSGHARIRHGSGYV